LTNSRPLYREENEIPEICYSRALHLLSEVSSDLLKNISQQLLVESNAAGYVRMRKTMLQDLKLESKALTSYYTITKSQPSVVSMEIVPDPNYRLIDDDRSREISSDGPRFAAADEDDGVE